jgi:RNA polymerase sigma factor (sigma-70 family)
VSAEAIETPGTAVLEQSERTDGPTDHALVRAVREGDDRAFELLYTRYQRRIAGYVFGMVKDYGRAEDITQEVFVSALRRMRATERPIAFKPWIYEIAKNACIDAYRRARHTEEVSFDADDNLSAADHGKLVASGPGPDAAIDTKQDLDHLCGAFGGLSDTHHEILVMRELEGLSYKDIGERLGMSRPAVESTLFRARKRLGEEYDELASGARCLRIQGIIAEAEGSSRLGLRDRRKLARHISHCQPCRRLAVHAGLDVAIPVRTRVAEKIAGLLPLPAFLRLRRGGGGDAAAAPVANGGGPGWTAHLPAIAEPLHSGWGKAAAGLTALLLAGAGAGVTTTMTGDDRDGRGTNTRPAAERDGAGGGAPARPPVSGTLPAAAGKKAPGTTSRRAGSKRRSGAGDRSGSRAGSGSKALGGGGAQRQDSTQQSPSGGSAPGGQAADKPGGGGGGGGGDGHEPASTLPDVEVPDVKVPASTGGGGQKVQEAANNVGGTVENAGDNVAKTVDNAVDNTQQILTEPENLVPNAQKTAEEAVGDLGGTVDQAVKDVGGTVGGLLKPD